MSGVLRFENQIAPQGLINERAERAVVSAMMLVPEAIEQAASLDVSDFAVERCRKIFVAARKLSAEGCKVDYLTVIQELARTGHLEICGGETGVSYINDGLISRYDVPEQVARVQESAQLRRLVTLCEAVSARAQSGMESSTELRTYLQSVSVEHESRGRDLRPLPVAEIIPELLDELREHRLKPGLRGISTGVADLDACLSGWREGELTYVGALPGRGKTAFLGQAMCSAACNGVKCGFISLEMPGKRILARLLAVHSGLHPSKVRNASIMTDEEWKHATHSAWGTGGLGDLPIEIYDGTSLRVHEVVAVARQMHRNGCKAVFIDFVQRIVPEHREARESINLISNVLADTCKSLRIPFVVASQLARRDNNPNRRPTMQDLRESGNLEQDADNVLLLYRPQRNGVDADGLSLPAAWTRNDEIIIAKQRDGITGEVEVTFDDNSLTLAPRKGKR